MNADEAMPEEGWRYSRPREWFAWRPIRTHDGLWVWLRRVWRWVEYPPSYMLCPGACPVTTYGFEPPVTNA